MIPKKCNLLKEKKGMALLIVLCLFALLMALGASMFFAAASTVSNAAQSMANEQASLSAKSFCSLIRAEITDQNSELKRMADQLEIGDELTISTTLPESLGEVEAVLRRTKKKSAVVNVTVTMPQKAQGKKSKMNIGFSRAEEEREYWPPEGGEPQTEIIVTWSFSGYGYPI